MDIDELEISSTKKGKDFWGRVLWGLIHILAYILQPQNQESFQEFLFILTKILPCEVCKKNLEYKIKHHPPNTYIKSSSIPKSSFYYSYILHDLANQDITLKNPNLPPKISPSYEEAAEKFRIITSSGLMYRYVWMSIHILAITLRHENIYYYKRFLQLIGILLKKRDGDYLLHFLEKYPIEPYLRNNHDAFFYSYMIHDVMNKKLGKTSPPYHTVKSFYFSALNEECNDCRV